MNEVIRAAAELQAFCVAERWRFCFIGGLAVQRWGEPRETVDVDLTLLTGFGGETPFVTRLLDRFEARIPEAAAFARDNRVLLLRAASGVGLDIALGGLQLEEMAVARSTPFTFPPDVPLRRARPRTSSCSRPSLTARRKTPRFWTAWHIAGPNSIVEVATRSDVSYGPTDRDLTRRILRKSWCARADLNG